MADAAPTQDAASGLQDLNALRDGGFSPKEIEGHQSEVTGQLQQGGFTPQEIKDYWGIKDPDTKGMKNHVETNLKSYAATEAEKPDVKPDSQPAYQPSVARGFFDYIKAGWQASSLGLGVHGALPDTVLPQDAGTAARIISGISSLAGDAPAMALGSIAGGAFGTEVPVAGTITGAGAGAFALPAAIRKILTDHYEKGDIMSAQDFTDRLLATTWETAKAGVTGLATTLTGGALAPAGKFLALGGEAAAMTAVSKGLEGKLPDLQDFTDSVIMMGGVHGVGMLTGKAQNIFSKTGQHPIDLAAEANHDVFLKQDLLSHDPTTPAEAHPTELKTTIPEAEPVKEGEEPKPPPAPVHELVPQDLSIKPPEPKEIERTPEEQEILSKIGKKEEVPDSSYREKFNSFYAKTVDWTDPLKVAYAAFKSMTGKELTAEENPHIQARLFAGHQDMVRMVLEHGLQDDEGKSVGPGLNDIYKRVPGDDQAGFDAYSMAQRGLELARKNIKPWADFSPEGAGKVVAAGFDKFEGLHQERVRFMNQVLQHGIDSGVIDPEIGRASIENNKQYIPFNRIIPPDELTGGEIGSGVGPNGKLLHAIEGSDLDIKNPRESFYNNVAAILRRVEVNDIRKGFLTNLSYVDETKSQLPTNDFVREVPVGPSGVKSNQVAIFRDGRISALEGTPDVIDSLKRLEGDKTIAGLTTQIASKFSQSIRVGTIADPGFGLRHAFRTSVMAGIYSQTGMVPFVHPAAYLSELMGKSSDRYTNWLRDGGASNGFDELEKSYIGNGLEEADSKYPYLDKAWNVIKKPLDATEAFVKLTDNLNRFTEYNRALDQGKSRDEAAFLSREVTPDFQKVGIQRSALRTLVAFQGAHLNSLDRMAQAFKEDMQGTILRMSVMSAVSGALWYANKDDKEIQNLPDYKKDQYWNFNVSRMFANDYSSNVAKGVQQSGTIFSVPKPWSAGIVFASGVERALDAYVKHDPEAFKGFGTSIYHSVIPNVIPTMIQPVLDQYANKNAFTGRQLVNNSQQKELPEMQYSPYTSETAKQLGKVIGYVPPVANLGPSADPLASPAIIDNYIEAWTGNVGQWAVGAADTALRKAGIVPDNTGPGSVAKDWSELPIMKEFMTRFPSMKSQPVDKFFENLDQTSKILNSIKDAAKKGDMPTAAKVYSENPDLEANLTGYAKAISTSRKYINLIEQNPEIKPVEKRQLIDTALFQIGSIANSGNQMMSDLKKKANQAQQGK